MSFQRISYLLSGILLASSVLAFAAQAGPPKDYVNAQLPWQPRVVDQQGKLLAWYQPEKNRGYDKVVKLAWDFIEHKVPNDTLHGTGLKIYLINSVFDGKTLQGSGGGYPASQFGQFVDSLVGWFPYSGDEEAVGVVRSMLDYQIAHYTTPADWNWAQVPFTTNGRGLSGMPDGHNGIETDKVGELGIGYALFYEMTGERKYLDEALHCGEALARHVRPGDEEHTPWPFRVSAKTGEVLAGEEYGGMTVAPVRLFDELIRLKEGDTANFQKARNMAWKWIVDNPLSWPFGSSRARDKWSGYFEDVPKNTENINQAIPTMTAYYLMTRPDPAAADPEWVNHVGHIIDWVRLKLGRGPYSGAWAIDEQGSPPDWQGCCSRSGLASDTSRWAAINAMYFEKTGDAKAREDAFRSLNYATYFAASDGKISCCGLGFPAPYWFDDGYGDYIRHFMWAMGAVPDFAPMGENHLLRSSSVVQRVEYSDRSVRYRTFDKDATEVLRLTYRPTRITAGTETLKESGDLSSEGYTVGHLSGGDYVIRVRHVQSNDVEILGK